ncbi:hypothetical protein [Lactococcus petauri]|uniref:hypothetical protein n=1 Tax=Lactococcus petauri TaxID=1940789 RepID=UPI0022E76759|nr:hypothetical protein [Lactococcus petauri]
MAKHTWTPGEVISSALLNDLEERSSATPEKGEPGKDGAAGLGVKSLALTTTDGKVTAGTVTFTDDTTAEVTVTEAPAK